MNGHEFSGNEKILLEQIIKLGEESEKLIQEQSGLIDNTDLRQEILPRATTHFLLIRLAYDGKLRGESEYYRDLTYPRELIDRLEERKQQLENDLDKLNKQES